MNVRFWYRYGAFMRDRYDDVYRECVRRGFNVTYNFNDVWKPIGSMYNKEFEPQPVHIQISKDRILSKLDMKPDFYKYHGKPVDVKSYRWALLRNDPKWIKNR